MSDSDRGQLTATAAEVYDELFVPALFGEWASRVADAAGIRVGQRVLDVACGTGVLTRALADRVRPGGTVVGLDVNDGMLAVAQRRAPDIDWRQGRAETMPFEAGSFDAVVSQFGLMFFDDKRAAIREMARVLRPGGRLAVAVWDALENTPGYATVTDLLQRLFGDDVADALRAPFALGGLERLTALFDDAGLAGLEVATRRGTARFASIESWMFTDVRGWTLGDMIDDDQFQLLVAEAEKELRGFVTAGGAVAFDSPAHIVTATKG